MSQLRVRPITALSRNLIKFVESMMAKEKWRPCLKEVETSFEVDPTGIFVGELNGKPISCVTFIKYDETFCASGGYMVEKEYRSEGYGSKTYKIALRSVLPSQNLVGYAVDKMVKPYSEIYGYEAQWEVYTYDLHLPSAFQVLSQLPLSPDLCFAKTIDEVDPPALYDYDIRVFGYPRKAFLQKFLRLPGSHTRVAVDRDDNIVGYTTARVAIDKDEGYRLGPLFAESSEISKVLLKALFEEMLRKGWSSSPSVRLESPIGRNAEAKRLMETLDGKVVLKLAYVTTKGIPKGRFDSWFAVTRCFLG